jgi:hypothetical protein
MNHKRLLVPRRGIARAPAQGKRGALGIRAPLLSLRTSAIHERNAERDSCAIRFYASERN